MSRPFQFPILLGILLYLCILPVNGQRIKDRIYVPLKDAHFCFRRTNGSSQFGCSSSIGGNVGILVYLESEVDVDRILGPSGAELAPYIALLDPHMFNGNLLEALEASKRIEGVLLLDEPLQEKLLPYSDDQKCPNAESTLDGPSTCRKWNPSGQATLFKDWSFPIMLVSNKESIEHLKKCYFDHNDPSLKRSWPFCAVEMRSHMYSAVDTTTCMRRSSMINNLKPTSVCDPMGDLNLFYTVKNRNHSSAEESLIMITTRLDSVTLFDGAEITAVSPVTGIVTMLALASMMAGSSLPERLGDDKNIILAFLNGESFDYIGSSRMVFDMKRGHFPFPSKNDSSDDVEDTPPSKQPPIGLDNLQFVLELDQMASKDDNSQLFGHYHKPSGSKVNPYLEALKSASSSKGINFSKSSALPPSSIMSILKGKEGVPGVVLSNYEDTFANPYYHSIYDTAPFSLNYSYKKGKDQELVRRVGDLVEMLMEFIYSEVTDTVKGNFQADRDLINELFHCYIQTANCTLFQASLSEHIPPEYLTAKPFPQYVGVQRSHIPHSRMTYQLLGLLTGEQLGPEFHPSNCTQKVKGSNIYDYIFMRGLSSSSSGYSINSSCLNDQNCGHCFKTTTFMTPAVSPAFVIQDYDFTNSTYPSWAESLWKVTSSRIFMKDSPSIQITHLFIGLLIASFSFILMWWLNRKAALLFSPVPSGNSSAIVTNDFSQAEAL